MSVDTAMDRLRAANPAPDTRLLRDESDDLNVLLADTWQRSTSVQTHEPQKVEDTPSTRRRGWLVAAAAAIVVAVLGAAAFLLAPGDGLEPVAPSTTTSVDAAPPTTVATPPTTSVEATPTTIVGVAAESDGPVLTEVQVAFIENYETVVNGRDSAAFADLFDPSAYRVHSSANQLTFSLEGMVEEAGHAWNQETTFSLSECEPSASGIACLTNRSGPVEEALAGGPVESRNVYSLDPDGKILKIVVGATMFDDRPDQAFRAWLTATHPEEAAGLVPNSDREVYGAFVYDDSELYLEWAPVWADLGQPTP
ncbi:MAG: hypothetical protein ACR2N2_08515 [Acidimicrobiia bacterium]